ncbi:hypothetical protein M434DRAFT_229345 [Hypoxylon sp. CO27-5]|nr:hypothetical protein M434DRAFT_229345 [Hypoxylon sp. CO27-5]
MEGERAAAADCPSALEDVSLGYAASFQRSNRARMRDLLNGDQGSHEVSGESSKHSSESWATPIGLFEEHLSPRPGTSTCFDFMRWLENIPTKYPSLATEPSDLSVELIDKIRQNWSMSPPDILRHGMLRLQNLNRHPFIRILRITDFFTLGQPEGLRRQERWTQLRQKDRLSRCGIFLCSLVRSLLRHTSVRCSFHGLSYLSHSRF